MAFKLDRRARGRKRANILATLVRGNGVVSCHIIELSEAGARLRLGDESVTVEGKARLVSAELGDIEVEIVWQKGPLVGLKFSGVPQRAAGDPAARKS